MVGAAETSTATSATASVPRQRSRNCDRAGQTAAKHGKSSGRLDILLADIKAAATNLYATMRGIGGVIMAVGLGMCGFKIFFQHDTENLKSAMLVIGGGVLIMVAPSIVAAVQGMTSGTTQTFQ